MEKELNDILAEFEYRGVILITVKVVEESEKKMLALLKNKSTYTDDILFKIYFILALSSFRLSKRDNFNDYLNEMADLVKVGSYRYAKVCMWRCVYNLISLEIDAFNDNYLTAKKIFIERKKYRDLVNLESRVASMKSKAKMSSKNILEHLNNSCKYYALYEDKYSAEFYISIGSLYTMTQNEVEKSISLYHKSLYLSRKYKTYDVEALGLYYLAEAYALINLKNNCIDILKKLIMDEEYIKFKTVRLLAALGLVDYYLENNININEVKELMDVFEKLMEEAEIDRVMQCRIKYGLSKLKYELLIEKDDYSEELKKIREIEYEYKRRQFTSTFLNTDYEIEEIYGQVYFLLGDYDNSLIHFKNALKLSERLEVKFQINSNKNVVKVYKKLAMYEFAYKYMLKANQLLLEIEHTDLLRKYISAYENYEILKANEEEKSQFLSEVSRELNTPIKEIYNSVNLINECKSSSATSFKEVYISNDIKIKKNCLRASRLVSNIIDIEKINMNMLEINFINCNIVYLVESITYEIAKLLNNKAVSIFFDTEIEEIPIHCDPYIMERIILNILYYGVKFSKSGSSILVSTKRKEDLVLIVFSFDKISLPNNIKNILFDKRIKNENNSSIEDSGIALDLVKELISLHSGNLSIIAKSEDLLEIQVYFPSKECKNLEVCDLVYDECTDRVKQHFFDII